MMRENLQLLQSSLLFFIGGGLKKTLKLHIFTQLHFFDLHNLSFYLSLSFNQIYIVHILLKWIDKLPILQQKIKYKKIKNIMEEDNGKRRGISVSLTQCKDTCKMSMKSNSSNPENLISNRFILRNSMAPISHNDKVILKQTGLNYLNPYVDSRGQSITVFTSIRPIQYTDIKFQYENSSKESEIQQQHILNQQIVFLSNQIQKKKQQLQHLNYQKQQASRNLLYNQINRPQIGVLKNNAAYNHGMKPVIQQKKQQQHIKNNHFISHKWQHIIHDKIKQNDSSQRARIQPIIPTEIVQQNLVVEGQKENLKNSIEMDSRIRKLLQAQQKLKNIIRLCEKQI